MRSRNHHVRYVFGGIALLLLTAAILILRHETPREEARSTRLDAAATTTDAKVSSASEKIIRRPLAVALSKKNHEWTAENAMDLKVIEHIAHNPEEAIRLIEENDRIKRRQLVYRRETVPMLLERTGGSLETFTLPGLDGREVEVEVTDVRLMNGTNGGCVNGRVKGRFNSMVSVGFSNGCESFNVLSPDEGLFLTADAREPGEVLVKEIDPNVYGRPPETNTPCVVDVEKLGPGHQHSPSLSK